MYICNFRIFEGKNKIRPIKLKISQRNAEKNLLFCCNLAQSYGECIYCFFVECTRHRLVIIKHTGTIKH